MKNIRIIANLSTIQVATLSFFVALFITTYQFGDLLEFQTRYVLSTVHEAYESSYDGSGEGGYDDSSYDENATGAYIEPEVYIHDTIIIVDDNEEPIYDAAGIDETFTIIDSELSDDAVVDEEDIVANELLFDSAGVVIDEIDLISDAGISEEEDAIDRTSDSGQDNDTALDTESASAFLDQTEEPAILDRHQGFFSVLTDKEYNEWTNYLLLSQDYESESAFLETLTLYDQNRYRWYRLREQAYVSGVVEKNDEANVDIKSEESDAVSDHTEIVNEIDRSQIGLEAGIDETYDSTGTSDSEAFDDHDNVIQVENRSDTSDYDEEFIIEELELIDDFSGVDAESETDEGIAYDEFVTDYSLMTELILNEEPITDIEEYFDDIEQELFEDFELDIDFTHERDRLRSIIDTRNENEIKFTGTIGPGGQDSCPVDGVCSIIVDKYEIEWARGWPQEVVGSIDEVSIGDEVEVYGRLVEDWYITLYGNQDYYVRLRGDDELHEEYIPPARPFENRRNALISIDSDNDGLTDYDEIVLYDTNPFNAQTVPGALTDGEKIAGGIDPVSLSDERIDYESPRETSDANIFIDHDYEVTDIVVSATGTDETGDIVAQTITLAGTALPNSYITLYIFSTPIIVTVKTNDRGLWTYELDQELDDGTHEVYVATVNNTGKIVARSQAIPFVKEAAAAELGTTFSFNPTIETPAQSSYKRIFVPLALSIAAAGVVVTLIWIGTTLRRKQEVVPITSTADTEVHSDTEENV